MINYIFWLKGTDKEIQSYYLEQAPNLEKGASVFLEVANYNKKHWNAKEMFKEYTVLECSTGFKKVYPLLKSVGSIKESVTVNVCVKEKDD
jgi:hypothetical protein